MGKIKTIYCEKYTTETPTASMRKLGPVAHASERQGLSELIEPKKCEIEKKLKTLHDPKYVDAFLEGIEPLACSQGWDWTPEIRDGVLAINRGQMTAAEIALEEGVAANVAQGFHHAVYHHGMGFCTFNGLALVAQEHPDKKVFVLDCDEHGGNGTEDFIGRLPNLRQITINGSSFGCRNTHESRCVTLDHVTDDFEPYLEALDLSIRLIDDWKPDLVIYQAGADPHFDDPLGSLNMTTNQMRERDRYVFSALKERGTPVMFVLAGGYQEPIEEKLMPLHVNTFEEAADVFSVKKSNDESIQ